MATADLAAPNTRIDLGRALRDAGITAVLTFLLLLPLIGFKTVQNIHNELALETRWPLLFGFVALAAVGRLVYSLTVLPWRERRARRMPAAAAGPSPLRAARCSRHGSTTRP